LFFTPSRRQTVLLFRQPARKILHRQRAGIIISLSYTGAIGIDGVNATVTDMIIALAHRLKIVTIAEGVETQEQKIYNLSIFSTSGRSFSSQDSELLPVPKSSMASWTPLKCRCCINVAARHFSNGELLRDLHTYWFSANPVQQLVVELTERDVLREGDHHRAATLIPI
jgi:EAL domain-containing protein (putative c-di-GMP-specific phosphodiesterase class I)